MINVSDYFDTPQVPSAPHLIPEKETLRNALVPFKGDKINADVALIGVNEDSNSLYNKGCALAPDQIRSFLYALNGKLHNVYLSDLGNLKKGKGLNDTYFALQDVVAYLLENNVIPLVVGGSHDLSFPIVKAISEHIPHFNFSVVDSSVDTVDKAEMHDHSFIQHILDGTAHGNVSVIGNQGYQSLENEALECLRVKDLRQDLYLSEPLLRDAHFTSFDISVVKASDASGCAYSSPNGLYAEQFCKLAHYAGLSDALKAFGLFGVNPKLDMHNNTAKLAAQGIWHFINGLDNRYKDYPLRDINSYSKKLVHQEDMNREIVFYHNMQNNRWWFNAASEQEPIIISCSIDDYMQTRKGKLPDRLMRFLR